MRTIITLDGKKISKKAACEMFGEADMNKRIRDAKEAFFEDPHEESSWWMGNGMLTIEFRQNTGGKGTHKSPLFPLVYLHKYTEFACYYLPLE